VSCGAKVTVLMLGGTLLSWSPICTAVWPPEHRADFLVASYDRYAAQVAAKQARQAAPAPTIAADPGLPNPYVPISCPGMVLTQGYGPTDFWMEPAVHGAPHFHTGWDLACPAGTRIVSVTAGTVHVDLNAGCGAPASGFGRTVQVRTPAGGDWIRYGHMQQVLVSDGQEVHPGSVLGLEGSTGCSTGPHLHFEVDRGCPYVGCSIDPSNVISMPVRR
jgi:murein DD-endopeptidase MepM/ murein hydrolase activator NlpD